MSHISCMLMTLNNHILELKLQEKCNHWFSLYACYACYEDLFCCSVIQEQAHACMGHTDVPSTVVIYTSTTKICLENWTMSQVSTLLQKSSSGFSSSMVEVASCLSRRANWGRVTIRNKPARSTSVIWTLIL